jgi:oligopeptide transport system substrate-binding protein
VVANKLDYLSFTPFSSTVNNKYKTDLPENRRAAYTYLEYQAIAFPFYDKRFADPKVRQAISMAIDRVGLIQKVYNGLRKPADGLVAPNVQGHLDNQCGDLCSYQPGKARRLFDSTGFQGPIQLTSNIDSGTLPASHALGSTSTPPPSCNAHSNSALTFCLDSIKSPFAQ